MKRLGRILSFVAAAVILLLVSLSVAAGVLLLVAVIVEFYAVVKTVLVSLARVVAFFGFWAFAVPWAWGRICNADMK